MNGMKFRDLVVGQHFQFARWSLDWLVAMGEQVKAGTTMSFDLTRQKFVRNCDLDGTVDLIQEG